MLITNLIKKIINKFKLKRSICVDEKIIKKIISNQNFPFLISFPRTGSHWLRMIMELYFKKPSLVRIFYYKKAKSFTCYHTHDLDLDIIRKNVIYLYRNPVDTIFSQLKYHNQDTNDINNIKYWAELYKKHLEKWLYTEKFTEKKTIITYEEMKKDMNQVIHKLCLHLNEKFDINTLNNTVKKVSKRKLNHLTPHDNKVVNLEKKYTYDKKLFKKEFSNIINNIVYFNNKFKLLYFNNFEENSK